jgi:magnesium chelatase subunit I
LYSAIPAITGKIELLYEGEQEGMINIAQGLISNAILSIFYEQFPQDADLDNDLDLVKNWFESQRLDISDDDTNKEYQSKLAIVTQLNALLNKRKKEFSDANLNATFKHFVIEYMVMKNYLSKFRMQRNLSYKDMMNSLLD